MRRAIFLDRDGTLNLDVGFACKFEDWHWLPGAIEALAAFQKAGWLLLVISNQSGIGRGYFSINDVLALERSVDAELSRHNVKIAEWFYCPHNPGDNCDCRKPRPGLILRAAQKWRVNLTQSWMVGDRLRDAQAGLAAGCKAALIFNSDYPGEAAEAARLHIPVWPSLKAAADTILQDAKQGSA